MKRCPNCDRTAVRTGDWACQWCGYPLLSNSYKKIDMNYGELREERLSEQMVAEVEPEPMVEVETEPVVAIEPEPLIEPEAVIEAEPEIVAETETAPEPEETPKPKPKTRRKPAAKKKTATKDKTAATAKASKPEVTADTGTLEAVAEVEAEQPKAATKRKRTSRTKSSPAANPVTLQADMEVTADDIITDYETDGADAEAKYAGKVLKVTGIADRIEIKDNLDIFYVTLNSERENRLLQGVRCIFNREHAFGLDQLEAGQTVTIQGTYGGSMIDISLRDCVLVE